VNTLHYLLLFLSLLARREAFVFERVLYKINLDGRTDFGALLCYAGYHLNNVVFRATYRRSMASLTGANQVVQQSRLLLNVVVDNVNKQI